MADEKTLLSVNNIEVIYDHVILVLKGVSLDVPKGGIVALLGANGAGKTTTIKSISNILKTERGEVTKGSISFEGEQIQDLSPTELVKKGVVQVMEGRHCFEHLTVEENLNFFATIFGTTIEENYDLIKEIYVQLEPFKDRRAGKLSGGMKQKLALCCALIHKPKVLFLDEPTTGVDPVSRKEFWEMLKRLQLKGITILVSTPYMDEAALCDRIALIEDGEILEIDTPNDIVKHYPKQIYDVKASNIYRLLETLKQYENCYSVYPFGEFLHYTDNRNQIDIEELKAFLIDKGLKEITIKPIEPTIEDTFMELAK